VLLSCQLQALPLRYGGGIVVCIRPCSCENRPVSKVVLRRERKGFGGCTRPMIHPIRLRPVVVERLLCDRTDNKATLDVGLQVQIDVTSNFSGSASIESIIGEIKAAMTWETASVYKSGCRTELFSYHENETEENFFSIATASSTIAIFWRIPTSCHMSPSCVPLASSMRM
jgi:hypothetical protein